MSKKKKPKPETTPEGEAPLPIARLLQEFEDKVLHVKIALERVEAKVPAAFKTRVEAYVSALLQNFAGLAAGTIKLGLRAAATQGDPGIALQAAVMAFVESSWETLRQIDRTSRGEGRPEDRASGIQIATPADVPPTPPTPPRSKRR